MSRAGRPGSVRQSWNGLLAIPIMTVLHQLHLAGPAPLWLLLTLLGTAMLIETPPVAARLHPRSPTDALRIHLSLAVDVLHVTAICYVCGWGPVLGAGYVVASAYALHRAGSPAWRPAIAWSVAGVAIGQLAIALGWCYSYLPPMEAHPAGVLGAAAMAMSIRGMGVTTEQAERAAAERTRAEEALRRSEERFRALVQDSATMIVITNAGGAVTYVSPAVQPVLGYRPEQFVELGIQALLHPDDLEAHATRWVHLVATGDEMRAEARLRHADGSWRWHDVTLRNLLASPAVNGVVYHLRDITDNKLYQQQLAYDASHDALTGLANRGALLRTLADACAASAEGNGKAAVLYLDLDGFKEVNDGLGHESGDELLRAVAVVLRAAIRDGDTVGRIGGDEFCVVVADPAAAEIAVTVAERVIERLAEPVLVGERQIQIRASIGVAVTGDTPVDADALLHQADIAMYQAKRSAGSNWRRYRPTGAERADHPGQQQESGSPR